MSIELSYSRKGLAEKFLPDIQKNIPLFIMLIFHTSQK